MAFGDDTFGVYDAKVSKLLTDIGTTGPTYDTAIDFRAVQEVTFEPDEGDRVDANGDDTVVASSITPGAMRGTMRGNGIPFAALKMMFGLEQVNSGSTPNQVQTFYEVQNPARPFWRLVAVAVAKGGGAVQVEFSKCQADGDLPPFALTYGEFGTTEVQFTAYWTESTQNINSVARKTRIIQRAMETAPAA